MKPKRIVYVGGAGRGDRKDTRLRCREGFAKLFAKCGFERQPTFVPSGGRDDVFRKYRYMHRNASADDVVMMLIDSESPVDDIEKTWQHLQQQDGWHKPTGTHDEQVLFMTTCMETWIVADREALKTHFGRHFNENRLPALNNLENRIPRYVFQALRRATNNRYEKDEKSFAVLGKLNPDTLEQHLPSFKRARRVLSRRLSSRR